jgi:Fe-S-cluster containining protein
MERDVDKLARFLRISPARFLAEYTVEDAGEGRILRRSAGTGCVFLNGNECQVYEARPAACVDFPHTVRGAGSIESRMWQFIDRATYCPIVYHTLEAWKDETGFLR